MGKLAQPMAGPSGGDGQGGFDGKTLLALALMLGVWLLASHLFAPKHTPQAPPETTSVGEQAAAPEERRGEAPLATGSGGEAQRGAAAGSPRSGAASGPEGGRLDEARAESAVGEGTLLLVNSPERGKGTEGQSFEGRWIGPTEGPDEVLIEGPLYRAVFDRFGGVLKRWELTRYTDAREEPANLVHDSGPGVLGLRIDGPRWSVALSQTRFCFSDQHVPREVASGSSAAAGSQESGIRILRFWAEGPVARPGEDPDPNAPRLRVERTYVLDPLRYDMHMAVRISGNLPNPKLDHALVVDWPRGIPNLETQAKLEKRAKGAVALFGQEFVRYDFGGAGFGCGCRGGKAARGGEEVFDGMLRWAGLRGRYFGAVLIPDQAEILATMVASSVPERGEVGLRLLLGLDERGRLEQGFTVYLGPIDYWILRDLDKELTEGTAWAEALGPGADKGGAVTGGADTGLVLHPEPGKRDLTKMVNLGGKLIVPISKATLWVLVKINSVVGNYGLAIIILSLLVRVIFHPLTLKSMQSQRKMQMLKPELDAINEKYKDDPQLRAKKIQELHKKHGVNPLGGCLPLLVQMPVIYALYSVLYNAIELRKAPFVLWIKDLASPDRVASIGGFPIHVLPLLMGLTMAWQQKLTATDSKQAAMMAMMPIFMVFIFYSLPSGLVLYWTVTNLMAIAQQIQMNRAVKQSGGVEDDQEHKRAKRSGGKRQAAGQIAGSR
ncbi:MAG: hypothetical protein DRJ64_05745 [Thermoprotei archaeon]|nr:MAG: hypothetical protein DRJ64_05745 [Thermoprotei archaeon]